MIVRPSQTLVVAGFLLVAAPLIAAPPGEKATPSCGEILQNLAEKKSDSLGEYLSYLDYDLDKSHLSDEEIDRIIAKLTDIQKNDPYQAMPPGREERAVYPNRDKTRQCIYRFRFQKIANRIRTLPMEERVSEIVDGILNPPPLGYETAGSFGREFVAAGKAAVPFIIRHRPKQPYYRRQIVLALADIGDPRGIPYIVEVLQTEDDNFRFERPIAAKALGRFKGESVIACLIEALKDQTHENIDRHLPPRPDTPGHKPYPGRYYSVQHAAATSLTEITGHDWGLLYNEDSRTWSAWLESDARSDFSPRKLDRTKEELSALVESLFHRYMSARPNPWQPQNALASEEGIRSIAEDLKPFGMPVVPILRATCSAQVAKSPIWREELEGWTQKLIEALPLHDAPDSNARPEQQNKQVDERRPLPQVP